MSENRYYYDRLTMALDDLLRAKRYAEAMLDMSQGRPFTKERTIYEALFVSFIVSYSRVFTSSNTVDETHKSAVSNKFGTFRASFLKSLTSEQQKFHGRIIEKRQTTMAHSDGISRNYQHYGDTPLAIGHNPFVPYEHSEVEIALGLVNFLISQVGSEQNKTGEAAFPNSLGE